MLSWTGRASVTSAGTARTLALFNLIPEDATNDKGANVWEPQPSGSLTCALGGVAGTSAMLKAMAAAKLASSESIAKLLLR